MGKENIRSVTVLFTIIILTSMYLFQQGIDQNWENVDCTSVSVLDEPCQLQPMSSFHIAESQTSKHPGLVWNKTYGGGNRDRGRSLVQCRDGGYAIIGNTESYGAGSWDAYLVKTDSDGNMEWNRTYGGVDADYAADIIELENGDFVFAGQTCSYPEFMGFKGWLVKTNSTGHFEWNVTYGDDHYDHAFRAMEHLNDNGYILTGYTNQGGALRDMWVVRTDENGTKLWDHRYGTATYDEGEDIIACSDGGFAAVGHTLIENLYGDAFLVRIDDTGTLLWSRTFGYNESDSGNSILESDDGCFVVAGQLTGYDGDSDAWLMKIDDNGNTLWQQIYGGSEYDAFYSIYLSDNDEYIISGATQSYGSVGYDGLIFEVDNKGNVLWNTSCGGPNDERLRAVIECNDGSFFAVGENGAFPNDVWALKFSSLTWNENLTDQYVEFNEGFHYDLNVSLSAGLHSWNLNDSSGFSIDGNGIITNQTPLAIGTYGLEVTVNDTVGGELIGTFSVHVRDTSSPSWILGPVDQYVEAGEDILYDLDASDVSGIGSWGLNASPAFAIDVDGTITNQFEIPVGIYAIHVWVTDFFDNTLSGSFTIYVTDSIEPSWVVQPTDQILSYGEDLAYTIVATDFSGLIDWTLNDTMNFAMSASVVEKTVTFEISNVGTLSADVYGLNITIADSLGNSVSRVFKVTVLSTDEIAPTWDEQPTNQLIEFGDGLRYNLNASDASGIDDWWIDDTTLFAIDGNGIVTNTTTLPVGLFSILVFTNDTQGNLLSASFTVTVQDTTSPSWIIEPEDRDLEFGQALDYQLGAEDLSGIASWALNDTNNFAVTSAGRIMSIEELAPGSYGLLVTTSDIYGNQLTAEFNVLVESATTTTPTTTTPTTTDGPTTPDDGDTLLIAVVSSVGGALVALVLVGLFLRKR